MVRPPLDFRELYIFQIVAATGNMTVAAGRLGMTQAAVSQAMKQLEGRLGLQLFLRAKRPLGLSAVGAALQVRAESILDQMESIPSALHQIAKQRLPEVRIGLIDTFVANAGAEFVKQMMGAAVRVQVESGSAPALNDALLGRRLDVVLTSEGLDDVDGLSRREIWQEPLVLVFPAHDPSWFNAKSFPEILNKGAMIRYTARTQLGLQIERHMRRIRVNAARAIEIDSSEALLAMVADGAGWAVTTPLCLLQGRSHLPQLIVKPLFGPKTFRTFYVVGRENENEKLVDQAAKIARRALKNGAEHRIRELWPWLNSEVHFGLTGGQDDAALQS
ncbi:LysR family transcriptional regulator [Agrobacterium cavarae]|uniref:LysR family transcriptional regulator n=1 Tax=Agrobacterium cavarae TaxID=2528239 RepID=UPI003FD03912